MNYFEAFTCAKDPSRPETNEDQIVLRPGVVYAVLDGATDISGERFDDALGVNATGGRLASRAAAQALAGWSGDAADTPPEPKEVLATMTASIGALYARLGRLEVARSSADHRFRTTFAGAFIWQGGVRLIRVGDSGFRVNGRAVLDIEFPADVVLSAARSQAWRLLEERGVATDTIRKNARQLIVEGLSDEDSTSALGFSLKDISGISDEVLSQPRVLAALDGDRERARSILSGGLRMVRADPGAVDALVLDGISPLGPNIAAVDFGHDEIDTLEVFSDGYPAQPDAVAIAAWEAALRHADQADPDRIGPYPSTKGCDAGRFGDDRSIIIARHDVDH